MQKAQIRAIQFLKAGKDAPKMLDFVDKAFDQVALSIQPFIILPQDFRSLMRRDHRFDAAPQQILDKIRRRITAIRDQALKIEAFQKCLRLRAVVPLSSRQTHPQRIAQAIHRHMDFAAKTAPTPTQRLRSAFFVRLLHTDAPAQSCCQSSRVPYPALWQNAEASAPTPPPHTSARSVYIRCSNSHTRLAATAIVLHFGSSISPLPQNGGRLARLCPHRHSGRFARNPGFSSIDRRLVSHLS